MNVYVTVSALRHALNVYSLIICFEIIYIFFHL
jgi:hypothetical protein